jgi:hypothetical protein
VLHLQNYQSIFSSNEGKQSDGVIPSPVNGSYVNTNPILPRTISSSSSYQNSPWLMPGKSWVNTVNGKMATPSMFVRTNQA